MARTIVVAGLAASFAASVALAGAAVAGTPSGQGAQKASLGPVTGSNTGCQPSSGSNGWAILNDPGKVGSVRFTNGEVHLVGGAPDTTYMIELGQPGSSGSTCTPTTDTLRTNGQGIGNGHITSPALTGSVFVALYNGGTEEFASSPVPLQ